MYAAKHSLDNGISWTVVLLDLVLSLTGHMTSLVTIIKQKLSFWIGMSLLLASDTYHIPDVVSHSRAHKLPYSASSITTLIFQPWSEFRTKKGG